MMIKERIINKIIEIINVYKCPPSMTAEQCPFAYIYHPSKKRCLSCWRDYIYDTKETKPCPHFGNYMKFKYCPSCGLAKQCKAVATCNPSPNSLH